MGQCDRFPTMPCHTQARSLQLPSYPPEKTVCFPFLAQQPQGGELLRVLCAGELLLCICPTPQPHPPKAGTGPPTACVLVRIRPSQMTLLVIRGVAAPAPCHSGILTASSSVLGNALLRELILHFSNFCLPLSTKGLSVTPHPNKAGFPYLSGLL